MDLESIPLNLHAPSFEYGPRKATIATQTDEYLADDLRRLSEENARLALKLAKAELDLKIKDRELLSYKLNRQFTDAVTNTNKLRQVN